MAIYIRMFSFSGKDIPHKEYLFYLFNTLFSTFFVLSILGFFDNKILLRINFVIKLAISGFLVVRFNEYNMDATKFTNFDRQLVLNLAIYNLVLYFLDNTQYLRAKVIAAVTPVVVGISDELSHI